MRTLSGHGDRQGDLCPLRGLRLVPCWCRGEILRKNSNKKLKHKCTMVCASTSLRSSSQSDLALESEHYDPSADAEDGAWLLLEADGG